MEIEFDPAKDAKNIAERGLPFDLAAEILMAPIATEGDRRRDYGERRMVAFGLVGNRLLRCVYTPRGEAFRTISLSKANGKEVAKWQQSERRSRLKRWPRLGRALIGQRSI